MTKLNMSHQSLLDEIKIAIDALLFTIPSAEIEALKKQYEMVAENPKASEGEILAALVAVGYTSWPYRKAYETMRERHGLDKQESYFRDHLAPTLVKKYAQFAGKFRIERALRKKDFELYFSADEKYQLEEALFEAKEALEKDMRTMIIGPKKNEYETELIVWCEKQKQLSNKIQELRAYADRSPQFATEILGKVRVFEEGWSVVERDVDIRIVEGEIEYYRDVIG